jgi:hypothetical protein
MTKRWKIAAVLAVIMMIALASNVTAQTETNTSVPGPQSNTNRATQGNFLSDVDVYHHVWRFGGLELEKFFTYFGFRANKAGTGFIAYELNAGYARHFGGLYLGLFYSGQITEAANASATTTTTDTTANALQPGGDYQKTSDTTTVANSSLDRLGVYNNLGALIGVAGQGIKVGFYETLTGSSKFRGDIGQQESSVVDTVAGSTTTTGEVTDYKRLTGWITPYLGWGTKLSLGGLTIKPKAGVDLGFYTDSEKYATNGGVPTTAGAVTGSNISVDGTAVGAHTSGDFYLDNGYFRLGVTLGAGLDFAPAGGHAGGVGLEWNLKPDFYSHKYDSASGGDTVKGTVSAVNYTRKTVTTTTTTDTQYSSIIATEKSQTENFIKPGFWYAFTLSDQVSLGVNGAVGFTARSAASHAKTTATNITNTTNHDGSFSSKTTAVTVTDGANTETSYFGVASSLGLGLKYDIKPGRFTLNAGIGIALPGYNRTATRTLPQEATVNTTDTEDSDGSSSHSSSLSDLGKITSAADSTTVVENWTGVGASYSLGGTFWFTSNFAVDMYFENASNSFDTDGSTQVINLFSPELSLLFTLKF